jgi:Uma2 family endonuclease
MSTTTATEPLLTAEEFFALPEPSDGSRQELVRGKVVTMPNPGFEHGEVQLAIGALLRGFAKSQGLGRVVTESGVVTDRKPDTVRGPDVSFYSKERLPLDKRVIGYHDQAPDLCIEVVSPSNTKKELRAKIKEFFFAGVRMVWVIDPEDRSVTILRAPDEGRTLWGDSLFDGGDVLPGFSCKVSDLFA